MVAVNNYSVGRTIANAIRNQIEHIDCLGTLQPVLVVNELPIMPPDVVVCKASGKAGASVTAGTGLLLHTVPKGKTFYVNSVSIAAAASCSFELRDSVTVGGGTVRISSQLNTGVGVCVITFPTPIIFDDGLFLDVATTQIYNYTFSGYEL